MWNVTCTWEFIESLIVTKIWYGLLFIVDAMRCDALIEHREMYVAQPPQSTVILTPRFDDVSSFLTYSIQGRLDMLRRNERQDRSIDN